MADPIPHTILMDFEMTRRKRFHILTDSGGAAIYSSPEISKVLKYLHENGHDQILCELPDHTIVRLAFKPVNNILTTTDDDDALPWD